MRRTPWLAMEKAQEEERLRQRQLAALNENAFAAAPQAPCSLCTACTAPPSLPTPSRPRSAAAAPTCARATRRVQTRAGTPCSARPRGASRLRRTPLQPPSRRPASSVRAITPINGTNKGAMCTVLNVLLIVVVLPRACSYISDSIAKTTLDEYLNTTLLLLFYCSNESIREPSAMRPQGGHESPLASLPLHPAPYLPPSQALC